MRSVNRPPGQRAAAVLALFLILIMLIGLFSALQAPVQSTEAPSPTAPTVTPHVAEPEMTGAMPGMVGMPASRPAPANSAPVTGLAIAGLLLLTAAVVAAIVMENRRRPRPAANPSETASD